MINIIPYNLQTGPRLGRQDIGPIVGFDEPPVPGAVLSDLSSPRMAERYLRALGDGLDQLLQGPIGDAPTFLYSRLRKVTPEVIPETSHGEGQSVISTRRRGSVGGAVTTLLSLLALYFTTGCVSSQARLEKLKDDQFLAQGDRKKMQPAYRDDDGLVKQAKTIGEFGEGGIGPGLPPDKYDLGDLTKAVMELNAYVQGDYKKKIQPTDPERYKETEKAVKGATRRLADLYGRMYHDMVRSGLLDTAAGFKEQTDAVYQAAYGNPLPDVDAIKNPGNKEEKGTYPMSALRKFQGSDLRDFVLVNFVDEVRFRDAYHDNSLAALLAWIARQTNPDDYFGKLAHIENSRSLRGNAKNFNEYLARSGIAGKSVLYDLSGIFSDFGMHNAVMENGRARQSGIPVLQQVLANPAKYGLKSVSDVSSLASNFVFGAVGEVPIMGYNGLVRSPVECGTNGLDNIVGSKGLTLFSRGALDRIILPYYVAVDVFPLGRSFGEYTQSTNLDALLFTLGLVNRSASLDQLDIITNDGKISPKEFRLSRVHPAMAFYFANGGADSMTEAQFNAIAPLLPKKGISFGSVAGVDNLISPEEFALQAASMNLSRDDLTKIVFSLFDKDNSGHLEGGEFTEVLKVWYKNPPRIIGHYVRDGENEALKGVLVGWPFTQNLFYFDLEQLDFRHSGGYPRSTPERITGIAAAIANVLLGGGANGPGAVTGGTTGGPGAGP